MNLRRLARVALNKGCSEDELIQKVAKWMAENLYPEDVFLDSQLDSWVNRERRGIVYGAANPE